MPSFVPPLHKASLATTQNPISGKVSFEPPLTRFGTSKAYVNEKYKKIVEPTLADILIAQSTTENHVGVKLIRPNRSNGGIFKLIEYCTLLFIYNKCSVKIFLGGLAKFADRKLVHPIDL